MTRDTRLVSYKENHYEDDRLHKDRIVADPAVLGGKPVVKATQIAVDLVVEELAANPNVDELLTAHPTSPATMYRRVWRMRRPSSPVKTSLRSRRSTSPPPLYEVSVDQSADFRLIPYLQTSATTLRSFLVTIRTASS